MGVHDESRALHSKRVTKRVRNVSRTMADVSEKKTVEKHRAYDVKFKLKVIEAATKTSISAASREFGIDRKRMDKAQGEVAAVHQVR